MLVDHTQSARNIIFPINFLAIKAWAACIVGVGKYDFLLAKRNNVSSFNNCVYIYNLNNWGTM